MFFSYDASDPLIPRRISNLEALRFLPDPRARLGRTIASREASTTGSQEGRVARVPYDSHSGLTNVRDISPN